MSWKEDEVSRNQIDRLTRRVDALEAQRKPRAQRVFTVLVENHMKRDQHLARFCAENGVTEHDLLIVTTLVPFETRPGETAKEAYERELRTMARKEPGRESQEALPHRREGRTGSAMESTATASTPPRRSPNDRR
jgi:hypothetical protein